VQAPGEKTLNRAIQLLSDPVERVEYLIDYEGTEFAFTGDLEKDLLAITAVHPMREDAVSDYLAQAGAGWSAVHRLVARGLLVEADYRGHSFYVRKLNQGSSGGSSA
jgi:hypothetical protein